ncbi:MAG: hypothetical protein AAGH68_09605 [Pseudomonadota bacterium]
MNQDHRAADEYPEQAKPSQTGVKASTASAASPVGQVDPRNPRFDYRLTTLPRPDALHDRPRRDLGRCLAEMRATMLELGHLLRPGKDHLHT